MKKLTALQTMHVTGGTSGNDVGNGNDLVGSIDDPSVGFTFTGSGTIRPPRGGRGGLTNP